MVHLSLGTAAQPVNHACSLFHNAKRAEWSCSTTGLKAPFLRSLWILPEILQGTEIRFPYQIVICKKGVQVYSANGFGKQAATLLPPARVTQAFGYMPLCWAGRPCPNGYG